MTFEQLAAEIEHIVADMQQLPPEQRRELVSLLKQSLDTENENAKVSVPHTRHLTELIGLGAELWQGIDAQQYIDELRNEWDSGT